jgi:protein-disulfide isomerase
MRIAAFAFAALLVSAAFAQPYPEKGKILGSPTAPIRIDVYSDFACPACRNFHETTLPMIIKDYVQPGKVYIVNREFPLAIEAHKYSRLAAQYAVAAGRLGIYQPVADALFRDQQSWNASGKVWETIATVLSPEQQKKVQTIFKDPAINTVVSSDSADGSKAGINSTPTLIVSHGTQKFPIPYPVNYNFLRSLLDGFLK